MLIVGFCGSPREQATDYVLKIALEELKKLEIGDDRVLRGGRIGRCLEIYVNGDPSGVCRHIHPISWHMERNGFSDALSGSLATSESGRRPREIADGRETIRKGPFCSQNLAGLVWQPVQNHAAALWRERALPRAPLRSYRPLRLEEIAWF